MSDNTPQNLLRGLDEACYHTKPCGCRLTALDAADRIDALETELAQAQTRLAMVAEFAERDLVYHRTFSKGGQHTGYSPSLTISAAKELQRMVGKPQGEFTYAAYLEHQQSLERARADLKEAQDRLASYRKVGKAAGDVLVEQHQDLEEAHRTLRQCLPFIGALSHGQRALAALDQPAVPYEDAAAELCLEIKRVLGPS